GVHDLEGAVGAELSAALAQPVHEVAGLLDEADAHERVRREGGVADPGVAVVPVAPAAQVLGQAAGDGGHHGPARLVGEELQRQRAKYVQADSQRRQYSTVDSKRPCASASATQPDPPPTPSAGRSTKLTP